jgi:hypothetical protein
LNLCRFVLVFAALVAAGEGTGHADPPAAPPASAATASAPSATSEHAVYVELLGKGGLYGFGYDYQFHRRVGVGAAGSYYVLDGQRVLDFSPYLIGYLVGTHRHRWFLQGGPQLLYVQTPSPVPEWPGASSAGIGGELCSGYEYRRGFLLRLFGMVTVGKGGTAPWMGVSLGWSI